MNNEYRNGNFTSSEIVALTKKGKVAGSFGVPALTYIEETNMERRLGRSLTDESNARPLTWGKLLEPRAFDKTDLSYVLCSDVSIIHPTIKYWSGSPDGTKPDTVIDIKCPMTLKSFCNLVDPLYAGLAGMDAINSVRENHKDGEKFYWQLVSNAILTNSKFAELIVYVPYFSELEEIKLMAQLVPTEILSKHYWIAMAQDDELPYLKDEGYYKNINIIRFEVPQSDKDFLTDCVLRAGELLMDPQPFLIAQHQPDISATIIHRA